MTITRIVFYNDFTRFASMPAEMGSILNFV